MRSRILVAGLCALWSGLVLVGACGKKVTVSDVVPIKATEVHEDRLAITVVNTYGSVLLKGGRGLPTKMGGRLLRKAGARGKGTAKKLLREVTVRSSGSGKDRKFVVVGPKAHRGDVHADLEMAVPVDSDITVQTEDGDVRLYGIHGQVKVDVDRGKVELRGMKGMVSVSVKQGDVFASGEIHGTQITTARGLVQVQWLSGVPEEDSSIRTGHGDLKVTVHKLFKASVRMAYGKGLHVGRLAAKKTGKGKAQLDFGQGGKLLVLEAPEGSLHVLQLSIVPPKPIRLKGPPPIRGGGLIKQPRSAKDIERLHEEDRRRMEQQDNKARQRGARSARTPVRRPVGGGRPSRSTAP